jgi:hypothetical protein
VSKSGGGHRAGVVRTQFVTRDGLVFHSGGGDSRLERRTMAVPMVDDVERVGSDLHCCIDDDDGRNGFRNSLP